jgi:hypothetical protein
LISQGDLGAEDLPVLQTLSIEAEKGGAVVDLANIVDVIEDLGIVYVLIVEDPDTACVTGTVGLDIVAAKCDCATSESGCRVG